MLAKPTLEIHVPISPTLRFFNQLRCFHTSLRRFGGAYRDAPVIATVGAPSVDLGLAGQERWLGDMGIEVRWVDEGLFRRYDYFATAAERFRYDFHAEVVLIADADLLIADSFEEMVLQSHADQALCGLVAHYPPRWHSLTGAPAAADTLWHRIYAHCGLGPSSARYQHTGWKPGLAEEERFCPPYFNAGVICAPATLINRIGRVVYDFLDAIREVGDTVFALQIALALAIDKLRIPHKALPMRYNFANDPELEAIHWKEVPHTRIIHLLRPNEIDRDFLFESSRRLARLVRRDDLRGINERARQILAEVLGTAFPA